ncbi:MAG: gliding motility lipoprotein GldB [Bacteroidetes bacterium]|nr:gliding motility lipoprotein GldB [Bacteroidota bacterium]
MNRLICFVSFFAILISCQPDEEKCVLNPEIKIDLKVSSLEDSIPQLHTKKQLVSFFSRHAALRDIFFGRTNYPDDSVFINKLFRRFNHPSFDTLLTQTKQLFGSGQKLKEEFQRAFANMKYYYPDFQPPRIETVITGMESDLYVSDSLIIVGLDYYLGRRSSYKPDMYAYMLRRYEENFIVPSALLLYGIDSKYNKTNLNDRTMMAEMITYGKAYYFAKHMLPCVHDSVFIGYTGKEIEGAKANQDMIWKRFVQDEALFSTSQRMKERYIGERPKTYEVGNECPGRIGTWVGWQIVNEFIKVKPDVSLPALMNLKDPQKIFKESKYRPPMGDDAK